MAQPVKAAQAPGGTRYVFHADMLRDSARNAAYAAAIREAIAAAGDSECRWLDIGTGSGLLASLVATEAARQGRAAFHTITAIETVSELAADTFARNGIADHITLLQCHSTELPAVPAQQRATHVVAELLDTGLLGEGLFTSMQHAKASLLCDNFVSIPHAATVYASLCESSHLQSMTGLQQASSCGIRLPATACKGLASSESLHVTWGSSFRQLSKELQVFSFDFTDLPGGSRTQQLQFDVLCDGTVSAVVYWWCAHMLKLNDNISMNTQPGVSPPPDHWRQAVYILPQPLTVQRGSQLAVTAAHNADEIWFAVSTKTEQKAAQCDAPVCTCGLHTIYSRHRLWQLNDASRTAVLQSAVRRYFKQSKHDAADNTSSSSGSGSSSSSLNILHLSDGYLLPVLAALECQKLGLTVTITVFDDDAYAKRVFAANGVSDSIRCLKRSLLDALFDDDNSDNEAAYAQIGQIDGIIAEPYFNDLQQEWSLESAMVLYAMRTALQPCLTPNFTMLPTAFNVMAALVQCDFIAAAHTPISTVKGVDMTAFNQLAGVTENISNSGSTQQRSSMHNDTENWSSDVSSYRLAEYPHRVLSEAVELQRVDLQTLDGSSSNSSATTAVLTVAASGHSDVIAHGLVLWIEYITGVSECVVSTGPTVPYCVQGFIMFEQSELLKCGTTTSKLQVSLSTRIQDTELQIGDISILEQHTDAAA
jgi:type III protein arginine methyltransferase